MNRETRAVGLSFQRLERFFLDTYDRHERSHLEQYDLAKRQKVERLNFDTRENVIHHLQEWSVKVRWIGGKSLW